MKKEKLMMKDDDERMKIETEKDKNFEKQENSTMLIDFLLKRR